MRFCSKPAQHRRVTVERTEGDFPHARRRSVHLACCTTTTCCFTLLLGGVGAVAGLITGLVKFTRTSSGIEDPVAAMLLGIVRCFLYTIGYAIAGMLLGAAVGFGIDFMVLR